MSWGEVKKINSNLGQSLDLLIKSLNLTSGGVKIVKSIQRGISNGTNNPLTISISKVDPSKCMVLIDGFLDRSDAYISTIGQITLNQTSLVVATTWSNNRSAEAYFTWQVIEFY